MAKVHGNEENKEKKYLDANVILYNKKIKLSTILNGFKFSVNEFWTGFYWIDGKKIYGKVIDFGSLPNNSSKNVSHNINLDKVILLTGVVYNSTDTVPLPYTVGLSNVNLHNYQIQLEMNKSDIIIVTGSNRTGYLAHVIVFYTKV